ncbi:glutaredoxin domain-containing protein [Jeotgalibaca caeni]|uniref:glutaredoxin domain-containing protein n=1 Tax=Jeotgalibaca caeni TaxID=3028623 RepID=UPI00237E2379|nr:glutaredoxin domain-containing protein [Jeotgalibaca caeni]MDE1547805.1 glutaredoxin domain-containing protein [Jeotgalibaca caeni]
MSKQVVVYSKPGCGECQFTKKYLAKMNIQFIEKNITEDPAWVEEVKALGFFSLPVVQVEGEEPFNGFQPERLNQLVSQNG